MDPFTMSLIMGGTSFISGLFNKPRKIPAYQPNAAWLGMQEDIFAGVREGIEQGGYTFDDATSEKIKRNFLEQTGVRFAGAERGIREATVATGQQGAFGRGLTDLYTNKAITETTGLREVDIEQARLKEQSRTDLFRVGAGLRDPNLPNAQIGVLNAQRPTSSQVFGGALETGLATGYNTYQAGTINNQISSYLSNLGTSSPALSVPNLGAPSAGLFDQSPDQRFFNQ